MITGELVSRASRLTADREPFVLATVVRARKPTSVRPGDSALVRADGTIEGFVGGHCAEASVRLHGLRVLETGEPLLLRLVPGDVDGLGPADEEGAVVERNPCLSGGALEIFLEPRLPAPRVTVVGSAPVAGALERIAHAAGFEVELVAPADARPGPSDAAVIVASHGHGEEQVLAEALRSGVPYVALVASRKRGEAVRASLELPDELLAQLHTPAGLDLGARTPAEVAISILAQLIAERHAHLDHPRPAVPAVRTETDPVCGMQVAVTESTPHVGNVYFCCEGCRSSYAQHVAGE